MDFFRVCKNLYKMLSQNVVNDEHRRGHRNYQENGVLVEAFGFFYVAGANLFSYHGSDSCLNAAWKTPKECRNIVKNDKGGLLSYP